MEYLEKRLRIKRKWLIKMLKSEGWSEMVRMIGKEQSTESD